MAVDFYPMICSACGHIETEVERELYKDCPCGGIFVEQPYTFKERPAAKSSTSTLTNVPGKIACQICGCRVRKRMGCQCSCHEGA